jgi:hypothetical protein
LPAKQEEFEKMSDPIIMGFQPTKEQMDSAARDSIGIKHGDRGTHTSLTIMLDEITSLLQAFPLDATRTEYKDAIIANNLLGKKTVPMRKFANQRLGEFYGLDPSILLFRVLRALWTSDERGRPLLALLMCLARDPLLRFTAQPIIQLRSGQELSKQCFTDAISTGVGGRLNKNSVDRVVRNTASSWTQSGHLEGYSRKVRRSVQPTPAVTAYALLLGYILGARGRTLFGTLWARVLDTSPEELAYKAADAKRLGYLDMKEDGGVIEISFNPLLTDEERRQLHGTH